MKVFEIGKEAYKIKTDWDELTVGDFIEIERHKGNKPLYEHEELWAIGLFELLTKKTDGSTVLAGELDNLKLSTLNEITEDINFIKEPFPSKLNRFVEIDGEKWAFVEKIEHLTAGEYISIKTIQENSDDNLDIMLSTISILLRKVDENGELENFNPKKLDERKELILRGKAVDIIGYIDFFFNKRETSLKDIKNSLMVEAKVEDSKTSK